MFAAEKKKWQELLNKLQSRQEMPPEIKRL
jgi:hypothetical protein